MSDSTRPKQPPSVSRSVHYHRPGTTTEQAPPVPAVVVALLPEDLTDAVQLFVMDPVAGVHFVTASYSEKPSPGKWSYPPYVAPAIVDKQPAAVASESLLRAPETLKPMATMAPAEKPTVPPPAPAAEKKS